jgi:hypothetical protein
MPSLNQIIAVIGPFFFHQSIMLAEVVLVLLFVAIISAYDIRQLDPSQRGIICGNQMASCDVFCSGKTDKNSCDVKSMTWGCVCKGGKVPNDTEITFPVPYFQCAGSYEECAANCAKSSQSGAGQACIDACGTQFKVLSLHVFDLICV